MISIVLPDLRGGGAERVSVDLARAFVQFGHQVEFVLSSAKGDYLDEAGREFEVFDLKAAQMRNVFWPLVSYLCARRPAAIIAMMWPLTVVLPVAAKVARFNGEVLICEHSVLSRQYAKWGLVNSALLRLSTVVGYRLATARVGVSCGAAKDMARLALLDASRVTAIHNPISTVRNVGRGAGEAVRDMWTLPGPRILSVGNLKRVKNHSLMLRAFSAMRHADAQIMLLGRGEDEAMLRALADELGISKRVIFAGFHEDPNPFYATADLLVLSSDHEGFGNVIVEALSFGLPVVSTNCPSGPAEILQNGRWGRLVPVGNADALARAIEAALSTPTDREALKRRAADFAPEIAARKYLDLLAL